MANPCHIELFVEEEDKTVKKEQTGEKRLTRKRIIRQARLNARSTTA